MPGKPAGSNVGLYVDSAQELEEGDIIATQSGRCYRVFSNRIQERGKHVGRQHLRAIVLPDDFVPEHDDQVLVIAWYSRNRKRAS